MQSTEFRRILGHLASAVTVVTGRAADGSPAGLTASAVTSVSLDPPLILACVDLGSDTHDCIDRAGCFAVSILGEAEEALARRFSGSDSTTKFAGVGHRRERTGAPVLDEALAWLDCRVWARYDGGDHSIFVGEVVAGDTKAGQPLLHFLGAYARLGR
jgi:flavin reductase (DIM6/NTAB) family NADH-FMN oxidoreductase RutF